jgi:hypothetical protein
LHRHGLPPCPGRFALRAREQVQHARRQVGGGLLHPGQPSQRDFRLHENVLRGNPSPLDGALESAVLLHEPVQQVERLHLGMLPLVGERLGGHDGSAGVQRMRLQPQGEG